LIWTTDSTIRFPSDSYWISRRRFVFAALEAARLELGDIGAAPGLQDELATVIRLLHGRLGFDEGGVP
jgi:hypothetical protein